MDGVTFVGKRIINASYVGRQRVESIVKIVRVDYLRSYDSSIN